MERSLDGLAVGILGMLEESSLKNPVQVSGKCSLRKLVGDAFLGKSAGAMRKMAEKKIHMEMSYWPCFFSLSPFT